MSVVTTDGYLWNGHRYPWYLVYWEVRETAAEEEVLDDAGVLYVPIESLDEVPVEYVLDHLEADIHGGDPVGVLGYVLSGSCTASWEECHTAAIALVARAKERP